jgi:hypothetical protein
MFTPRMLADGRICCSHEDALCPKCKAALRTAAPHRDSSPPPDPYAAGLAKLRADLPTAPNHRDSSSPPLDSNGIPDPYAAGLEKMRKEHR